MEKNRDMVRYQLEEEFGKYQIGDIIQGYEIEFSEVPRDRGEFVVLVEGDLTVRLGEISIGGDQCFLTESRWLGKGREESTFQSHEVKIFRVCGVLLSGYSRADLLEKLTSQF